MPASFEMGYIIMQSRGETLCPEPVRAGGILQYRRSQKVPFLLERYRQAQYCER